MASTFRWFISVLLVGLLAAGCFVDLKPKEQVVVEVPVETGDQTGDETTDTTGTDDTTDTGTDTGGGGTNCVQADRPACPPATGICVAVVQPECDFDTGEWTTCQGVPDDYEADVELSCDGKDNDCDGQTDEEIGRSVDVGCKGSLLSSGEDGEPKGVCGDGAPSVCQGLDDDLEPLWRCDYSGISTFEADEASCDGLDNDCDGDVDEDLGAHAVTECGFLGVCAQIPKIKCAGVDGWDCDPDNYETVIPNWQPNGETKCDGLDNNCDGTIDEGIAGHGFLSETQCPKSGVCGQHLAPSCNAGVWECNLDALTQANVGYEPNETSCDGVDNDCDGLVDETAIVTPAQCDEKSKDKATKGVCNKQATAQCGIGATVTCKFDDVPNYEENETLCDGLDNDCDGLTDADDDQTALVAPVGKCPQVGVCTAGLKAVCEQGGWTCTYNNDDYQAGNETECDGLDNDCDGEVDENIVGGPTDCPGHNVGVCKGAPITAACAAGKYVCDFTDVPGYEAGAELTCDGLDNNCNGIVDEGITDLAQSTCLKQGVCSGENVVFAKCVEGGNKEWDCDYDVAKNNHGYEPGDETKCDGLDNDCDGFIDEGIIENNPDPDETGCPNQGVCAGQITAFCVGDGWECNFASTDGYQNPETTCDGLDNDCDGEVDEGVCPAGAECEEDGQCLSGLCRPDVYNLKTYCVSSPAHCPGVEGGCGTEYIADSDPATPSSTCYVDDQDIHHIAQCTATGWAPDFENPCEGVCVEDDTCNAICGVCIAGTTNCDDSQSTLLTCDETGNDYDFATCPEGTQCLLGFKGICLNHDDKQADPGKDDPSFPQALAPSVFLSSFNQPAVVYHAGADPTFNMAAQLLTPTADIQADFVVPKSSGSTLRGDASAYKSGDYATTFVWQSPFGTDPGNIQARVYSLTGAGGLAGVVTVNETLEFEQSWPRVADRRIPGKSTIKGALVIWQTNAHPTGNGTDIMARAYDIKKGDTTDFKLLPLSGGEQLVNTTTDNNQVRPAVASLANDQFVVAWSDSNINTEKWGVYGRILDTKGLPTGTEFALIDEDLAFDKQDVALTPFGNGFAAVWTGTTVDGGDDIYLRTFDSSGGKISTEILVTDQGNDKPQTGFQRSADIATTGAGELVLVWEEENAGDGQLSGIQIQQFGADLVPKTVQTLSNGPGAQTNPSLTIGGPQAVPYAFACFESDNLNQGKGGIECAVRVLE